MLILTRRPGESIVIGDNIRIVVAEIRNGQVRLAFDAPAEIEIDRTEIRAKKEAAR